MKQDKQTVFTFVVPTLSSGGAERVVSVLASRLAEKGYETHVIVYYKAHDEYPVSPKVDVVCDAPDLSVKNGFIGRLAKLYRVRKRILGWNTTYVIPFLSITTIHTYLATRFSKVKFIATIRNNPRNRSPKMATLCDAVAKRSAALFAQTQDEKDYYPARVQKKTFVLPNPVNEEALKAEHSYRRELRSVILAGRLSDQKNYPMLLRSARILKDKGYDLRYKIFGEGPDRAALQKAIDAAGLGDTVFLMGRTSRLFEEYSQADLYVMTSNFEGMPNALMEAMAVGLPCISTDCPSGPSDLIEYGENGVLVPVDDAQSLAEEIERMICDPAGAERMGRKARQTIREGFTPEIIAERFVRECMKY